jgi:hypothetical protein
MHDLFGFLRANHDLVAAISAVAALFVSTVSILLAIFNMTTQRTHNRKSLMPIAHVRLGDYENRIFVRLHNDGIGPMIIDSFVVATNRRGKGKKRGSFLDFMPDLPPGVLWTTFVTDLSGWSLSADKDITLLLLEGDPSNQAFVAARQSVRQALAELKVTIKYRDIYGHKMPTATRDLEWFASNADVGGVVRRKVAAGV